MACTNELVTCVNIYICCSVTVCITDGWGSGIMVERW